MEDSLQKVLRDTVCLSRPYPFKFFKGYVPQNLLGPFLNTLTHMPEINLMWEKNRKNICFVYEGFVVKSTTLSQDIEVYGEMH